MVPPPSWAPPVGTAMPVGAPTFGDAAVDVAPSTTKAPRKVFGMSVGRAKTVEESSTPPAADPAPRGRRARRARGGDADASPLLAPSMSAALDTAWSPVPVGLPVPQGQAWAFPAPPGEASMAAPAAAMAAPAVIPAAAAPPAPAAPVDPAPAMSADPPATTVEQLAPADLVPPVPATGAGDERARALQALLDASERARGEAELRAEQATSYAHQVHAQAEQMRAQAESARAVATAATVRAETAEAAARTAANETQDWQIRHREAEATIAELAASVASANERIAQLQTDRDGEPASASPTGSPLNV